MVKTDTETQSTTYYKRKPIGLHHDEDVGKAHKEIGHILDYVEVDENVTVMEDWISVVGTAKERKAVWEYRLGVRNETDWLEWMKGLIGWVLYRKQFGSYKQLVKNIKESSVLGRTHLQSDIRKCKYEKKNSNGWNGWVQKYWRELKC